MNRLCFGLVAVLVLPSTLPAATIAYSGAKAEQQYTITTAGVYALTVAGAQGGNASYYNTPGGLGAVVTGDFTLAAGEVLDLYIGQQGNTNYNGGGGGGTFLVADGSDLLLLVGGGGGGASGDGNNASLANASTSTSGNSGYGGSAGGTGGSGGSGTCPYGSCAGGGGGYSGDGGSNSGSGFPTLAGNAYGGGGEANASFAQGGGGGGYSGGGAGYNGNGGGGGSYYDFSAVDPSAAATNTGSGYVEIDYLGPAAATTPEPSALSLTALGLCVFSTLLYRARSSRRTVQF